MIIETIISTVNSKGKVNFAPFGIKKNNNFIYISPYIPSRTLENLNLNKCAVINYTDDARYFVDCLVGEKKFKKLKSFNIDGFYLQDCLSHEEVKVVSIKNDKIRPTFKCEIVGEYNHKKFLGFNRAKASILEGCILASRLKILDEKKIRNELDYLNISVTKTGSYKELRSWKKLNKYIEDYFENKERK